MKSYFHLILTVVLITQLKAKKFLLKQDYYGLHPTAYYKCFRDSGYQSIGLNLPSLGIGEDQSPFITNIYNAKSAGLSVEVLFYPCNSFDSQRQVQSILKYFGVQTISRFWILPYFPDKQDSPQCSIEDFSPRDKCTYLQSLVSTFKQKKLNAEIIAYRQDWNFNFNGAEGCPQLGNSLLLWVPQDDEINDNPNFNDYIKFGGWDRPYIKLLQSLEDICGVDFYVGFCEEQQ